MEYVIGALGCLVFLFCWVIVSICMHDVPDLERRVKALEEKKK